jgi:serine-threonine kinase receptor-associated protein
VFVAGGSDVEVRVFDSATGSELECHKGHHGPVRCVRFSPGMA